jgi:hypothetical protein
MEQRMFLFFSNARVMVEEKYTENHKKQWAHCVKTPSTAAHPSWMDKNATYNLQNPYQSTAIKKSPPCAE